MKTLIFSIIFVLGSGLMTRAEDSVALKVIEKSRSLYRLVLTEREEMKAVVVYDDGRKQEKSFARWIKYDSAGEDKLTIKFTAPPMDSGLGLLTWRHPNSNDEQWLKQPSRNRARKVSISDQGTYFAGTDLTYEDARQLISEQTKDFVYSLEAMPEDGWLIKATPKANVESAYGYRLLLINNRFALVEVKYFDKDNRLIKTQVNSQINYQPDGVWRANKVVFDNRQIGRRTTFTVKERETGKDFSPDPFTLRFLISRRN